jgi:hypothetical protein
MTGSGDGSAGVAPKLKMLHAIPTTITNTATKMNGRKTLLCMAFSSFENCEIGGFSAFLCGLEKV